MSGPFFYGVIPMYRSGLVLEGGGSRGIFTSGVLDCFMERGIEFPYVIGVSAGSCNAASYISKSYHRQRDITLKYVNDKRYMSLRNFITKGEYLNYDWIFGELSYDLMPIDQSKFDNAHCRFVCVVTNEKTGQAEYLDVPDMHERGCVELRASCALPIATKGAVIGGQKYYDGGIADSIPAQHAIEDGCEKIVVVLTQDINYVKPSMDKVARLVRRKYKNAPKLAEAILNRHNMYNSELAYVRRLEEEGRALAIRPPQPLHCPTLEKNTEHLQKIYDYGYQTAEQEIERIEAFLK